MDTIARIIFNIYITNPIWGLAIFAAFVPSFITLIVQIVRYVIEESIVRRTVIIFTICVLLMCILVGVMYYSLHQELEIDAYLINVDRSNTIPRTAKRQDGKIYTVYACYSDTTIYLENYSPIVLTDLISTEILSAAYMWEIDGERSEIAIAETLDDSIAIRVPYLQAGDNAVLWANVFSAVVIRSGSKMRSGLKAERQYATSGWIDHFFSYVN